MKIQSLTFFAHALVIPCAFVLVNARTAAGAASISGGGAGIQTNTVIQRGSGLFCECNHSASLAFPPHPPDEPDSASRDCPACSETFNDTMPPVTVSVGASHVDATYSGSTGFLSFTTNAKGGPSSTTGGSTANNAKTSGGIEFEVTGQAESVSISVSGAVSGENGSVAFQLFKDGVSIATMTIDQTGPHGSIPSGTFGVGSYSLEVNASNGAGATTPGKGFTYSASMFVAVGVSAADIHWNNPAGGNFANASNWNPQQVPTSLDHAIFDLPSLTTLVAVEAGNVAVSKLSILGMPVRVHGTLQVLHSSFGLDVGQQDGVAGRLQLESGATLLSNDGFIGSGIGQASTEASVVLSGQGTRWTIGASNPLQIGFLKPGVVIVDQGGLLNAQKEIDVGSSQMKGRLEVHNNALVSSPALTVGNNGGGSSVLVDSGGSIDGSLRLGNISQSLVNAQGVVTIAGISTDGTRQSRVTALAALVKGASGTEIEVKDGGLLDTSRLGLFVGDGSSGGGRVHVHGRGGSFPATVLAGNCEVGSQFGPSELVVEDGGAFSVTGITDSSNNRNLEIGLSLGDIGTVTVSNTGAGLFHVAGDLVVGGDGQGTLTISSSGKVTSDSAHVPFATAPDASTLGEVLIIGPQLPTSPDSEWDITGDCVVGSTARGVVTLLATRTVFPQFGVTLKVGGVLRIEHLGKVLGNGRLVAGDRVVNGGMISPGLSPGMIEIDGDYEQTADGVLNVEAAGLDSGQFDVLHITGSATLDGTLEMHLLNNYLPKKGDSFNFLKVDGPATGSFAQVSFPEISDAFQFSTALVDGGLQLTALNDAVLAVNLANISTRALVGTGDNVTIGGFIVQGSGPKRVLIRALGPTLAQPPFNVPGVLNDPVLQLHDGNGAIIAANDNWMETQLGGIITADQVAEIQATNLSPSKAAESTILANLDPGSYTAIVRGVNGTTGIGLVEIFDLSPSASVRLGNISTRGLVQRGDEVMIGGFIVGNKTTSVLVRALGPTLGAAPFNVPGALADPKVELHNGQGDIIGSNDSWQSDQATEISATGLAPANTAEAAILARLAPGNYTAIVRGAADTTGVGLIEGYKLD